MATMPFGMMFKVASHTENRQRRSKKGKEINYGKNNKAKAKRI